MNHEAKPIPQPRPPRVVIIGAGMSGMVMGIKLLATGNRNF